MNPEEPIKLDNYTLILLAQMGAGEWHGPDALTHWFRNDVDVPGRSDCPSDIGINERRRLIIELAAAIHSSIEEWVGNDHERTDILFYENPGWGDWDTGFIPRLVEEAMNACNIHTGNCELLDKDETWLDIHTAIERMCLNFRGSNKED